MQSARYIEQTQKARYLGLNPSLLRIKHVPVKRAFDILFCLMVMLLGCPLFLLVAVLVKATSKGPLFYRQQRIGRGGAVFTCLKFRTMYPDADKILAQLLHANPKLKQQWKAKRKLTCDPRVTPVGNFLRKSCLDELPQFWNVLKGDLSVVGPRPVCEDEVREFFGAKAYKILQLRPGLTGIWQTKRSPSTTYAERLQMDEEYVNDHSLLLDSKLIAKTILQMLRSKKRW